MNVRHLSNRFKVTKALLVSSLLALAFSAPFVQADYASEVLADSPLGYWQLDETSGSTATDSSGNGRHGTYLGGITLGTPSAVGGTGASATFDGSSGYVALPGSWGGSPAVTIEAWVSPASIAGTQAMVSSSSSGRFCHFQLHENSPSTGTDVTGCYGPNPPFGLLTPALSPLDTWRHIVMTMGGGHAKLYINGVMVQSVAITGTNITASSAVSIARGFSGARHFGGAMDEVAIYDTVLSAGRIFTHYYASFSEIDKLRASDGATNDRFGTQISVDGNTALVSADNVFGIGSAYIFERIGGEWTEQAILMASDGVANDRFGTAVALDGDTALVTAFNDDDNGFDSGSVYVFERASGVWTQTAKLTHNDAAPNDGFGWSVAIEADTALIGMFKDDDNGAESGSAYVFERASGVWTQVAKLTPSDGAAGDSFGLRVSLDADTALISASNDDSSAGSTYVFVRVGGVWTEQAKLTASDRAAGDHFGNDVALDGDTALISAHTDDSNAGSAYVFVRVGGVWTEQAKLTASDRAAGDIFGYATSIQGNTALIGAFSNMGADPGSAYVFERMGGAWTQVAKLTPSDGAAGDWFGRSAVINGDTLMIGAMFDDDNGGNSGSVYVFASAPVNEPPVAVAGSNQSIHVGQLVHLNGSGSNDAETLTEDLVYAWSFDGAPVGSAAVFDVSDPIRPTFVVDLPGDYHVGLVVTDEGGLTSDPNQLTVSSLNTPPMANAGIDQSTYVGNTVVLDGSASSDPDFDPIASYHWHIATRPAGSTAVLSNTATAFTSFVPDLVGSYTVDLIVSDGYIDSAPDLMIAMIATTEDYASVQTVESFNAIASLPESDVTTSGNQTALGNVLMQVIESLQADPPDIDKAIKKLEAAIERTDGCALRGTPDLKGSGQSPKADTITSCTDQEEIYPVLVDALTAILP